MKLDSINTIFDILIAIGIVYLDIGRLEDVCYLIKIIMAEVKLDGGVKN